MHVRSLLCSFDCLWEDGQRPAPSKPTPRPWINQLYAGQSTDRSEPNETSNTALKGDETSSFVRSGMMDDRTLHVPPHVGGRVLPCHSLFQRLLRLAEHNPPRLAVRDDDAGSEATHIQLLTDVLALRQRLWEALGPDVREAIDRRHEVYIAVLAPGGYEFTVATLAVLATGAAVVPMTVALPPEEALYFATKSQAAAVLTASAALKLGVGLEKLIKDRDARSAFSCVPIAPSTFRPTLQPDDIAISSDLYLDDNAPGVVIFTSGTTGPPKGSVMRRAYTFDGALAVADHYRITQDDVLLHLLPVHHATGLGIMFFPFLISGALMEFRSGPFSAEWTWERWRKGGLTVFSGVPTIYMRMMRFFQRSLAHLPAAGEYVAGARSLRACLCGTSALPKPISDFWADILSRKILLRYGSTETGAVFKVGLDDGKVPDGSVGTKFPGYDVRLAIDGEGSDGTGMQGEVQVKGPEMFSKYIFDPSATAAAHTAGGFYKTGDIARREGQHYFILGRASVDIIKTGGYKISALDIEREIMALPYVNEVMVVGVPDEEFGQRVAGAVCLKGDEDTEKPERGLTIDRLRRDLRERLAGYKMPTLLRLVDGELPKSGTGKVQKKILGPRLFPEDYRRVVDVQVWRPTEQVRVKAKI